MFHIMNSQYFKTCNLTKYKIVHISAIAEAQKYLLRRKLTLK